MNRIPFWAIGPILLACALLGGTSNPDDSVAMLAGVGGGFFLLFTVPKIRYEYFLWTGKGPTPRRLR